MSMEFSMLGETKMDVACELELEKQRAVSQNEHGVIDRSLGRALTTA
jgi:hypothetical protein